MYMHLLYKTTTKWRRTNITIYISNQEYNTAQQGDEDDPWNTKMFEDIELDEVSS